ncbi:MAG: ATP-binding protein [Leptospiraceae bacterium]|nr:ATP-binding protein [Leptospiraceae bacterium]MCK6382551.1 ATP-binding protein [Leptospiraceae bacterium]NUM41594.1 ATP-binding protein [Leptospiraceae bacterium]
MKENKNAKPADFSNIFRLQIPSNPKHVSLARNFVYNLARENGFTLHDAFDIKLITGEALINVIKHSYLNRLDKPIFIEIKLFREKIEIRIRDFGIKANLEKMKSADMNDYREDGLGILLLRSLCNHFYIDQSPEIGNKFILMKIK